MTLLFLALLFFTAALLYSLYGFGGGGQIGAGICSFKLAPATLRQVTGIVISVAALRLLTKVVFRI